MESKETENLNEIDPVLKQHGGLSTEIEYTSQQIPPSFTKFKKNIFKTVSLYLQLLWDSNNNGKIIDVYDLVVNSKKLFGTRFISKDIFWARHIASDLREISLSFGTDTRFQKYFKNIDTSRIDVAIRIDLSVKINSFLSKVVHLNYCESYKIAKEISSLLDDLSSEDETLMIPSEFKEYFDTQDFNTFNEIFEKINIIYIFNFYQIFSEFLYNEAV